MSKVGGLGYSLLLIKCVTNERASRDARSLVTHFINTFIPLKY